MEKHKCKLCYRSFSNGRALGGHMRSHMMNLSLAKPEEESSRTQLSFEAESAPSSSSEDEGGDDEKGLSYGLRENPKRSIRLVDPEFSFVAADTGGSVILQEDRESETESSKNNPTRRRSKRAWKLGGFDYKHYHYNYNNNKHVEMKKVKFCKTNNNNTESWVDHEPASSVSDATTEEDVAFCLMMLSRDKWKRHKDQQQRLVDDQYEEEEEEEEDDEEEEEEEDEDEGERSLDDSDESQELMKMSKNRVRKGRYKCETCNKVFRSYQALGGHRASHKKIRANVTVVEEPESERGNCGTFAPMVVEKKIHECPVCYRVFASGQALGGHKRTHVTGSTTIQVPCSSKFGNSLIDLNLPAPIEDDDISQIENSAVSDAEFLKTR